MLTADQERRLEALRDSLPGQVLPGSDGSSLYPLRERLGEGGQGWVFRATWNGSVDVVVKVLRPETETRDSLARFQREAQVLRTLAQQPRPNPHVVRFFDHAYANVQVASTGDTWTLPFTVMEYVSGITLEAALTRAGPGGLGLERTRRFLRHVVLALKDVHAQGVVHRDLKPSNILIETTTSREIAKVTDFGLAKLVDAGLQRTTGLAGATVGYAPPEQFERGNLRVGPPTDVFSLAAIVYEMMTGLPAFPFGDNDHPLIVMHRILEEARPALARVAGRVPRELAERPDVLAALDAELGRALSPDPTKRHATITELHDALEHALTTLGAAPSLPAAGQRGGLSVSPGSAPPQEHHHLSAAPTLLADERGDLISAAPPPPSSGEYVWRRRTDAVSPEMLEAIAISSEGDAAIAAGRAGAMRWDGAQWQSVRLPPEIDPRMLRTVAWFGHHAFWAGASQLVISVAPAGGCALWHVDVPGIVFHGAYADRSGVLLAGERTGPAGAVGVVTEIALGGSGPSVPRTTEIVGAGALRAVTRLDAAVLAAGDGGALALLGDRGQAGARVVRVCDAPLNALVPLGDGTASVAGGGGFVFRVWPTLDVRLEAIQTTRDIFALARATDGAVWCGGAERRVLRRDPSVWVRIAGSARAGRVRALHATPTRVIAFFDDGAVSEATRR